MIGLAKVGQLKANKLLIKNTDTGEELAVQYNPERYSIERSAVWEEQGKGAELQFGGTGRKSITLEFFFDTYADADRSDVRSKYVNKLLALMQPTVSTSSGKKRPPVLLLSWGPFTFQGVLEKLAQNYTMFTMEGQPVRAVVNATFKQFTTPQEEARGNPPGDPSKVHRVKEGETLSLIAAEEYGDPSLWRIIANENRMGNPRALKAGDALKIPPLI